MTDGIFSYGFGFFNNMAAFLAFQSIHWLFISAWLNFLKKQTWVYRSELELNFFRIIILNFRGAQTSEDEEKQLNERAGRILRSTGINFEDWKDVDWLRRQTLDNLARSGKIQGYADYYLAQSGNGSNMVNEADVKIYSKLVQIDSMLGIPLSRQLAVCLCWTTRWDIIKV